MRIRSFDIGLESIGRWQIEDEIHLPAAGPRGLAWLPQPQALDAILRRPTLDERLPQLLQPARIDPALLEPARLSATRLATAATFRQAARRAEGRRGALFAAAADMLLDDAALDDEIRAAIGALLRG